MVWPDRAPAGAPVRAALPSHRRILRGVDSAFLATDRPERHPGSRGVFRGTSASDIERRVGAGTIPWLVTVPNRVVTGDYPPPPGGRRDRPWARGGRGGLAPAPTVDLRAHRTGSK